jgi:hypothetical protein
MSYNIYEKISVLAEKMENIENFLRTNMSYGLKNENLIIAQDERARLDVDNDLDGFMTIDEIVLRYYCPKSTFYYYQKQLDTKLKVHKFGNRKNKYCKKELYVFFKNVSAWRSNFRTAC